MVRATFMILKYALIESCCLSMRLPRSLWHPSSRGQNLRTAAVVIPAFELMCSPLNLSRWISLAASTLAATAALLSPCFRLSISSEGTGRTRTWRSILSMIGPESLDRYAALW